MLSLLLACTAPDVTNDSGVRDGDSPAADTALATDATGLVLNEFLAYGFSYGYAGGEDWVELYNAAPATVDLSGLWLWADDGTDQLPWRFPDGSTLAPGGYLVVICDEGYVEGDGLLHASFRIGRQDGSLELRDSATGVLVDWVDYGFQPSGVSSARVPDGAATWVAGATSTPGVTNGE
ncbi:MAG: lamin tail domain-containing protein [Pseudomonadota bacterium]|nr:lamin tail domain-containing protein [Pseudomonadota bacterium]